MLELLRQFEEENDAAVLEDEQEEEGDDIEQRFSNMNIGDADASEIWNRLSAKEREEFEALVNGKEQWNLTDFRPWWQHDTTKRVRFVQEQEEEEAERSPLSMPTPALPEPIPDIKSLTKKIPEDGSPLQWNLVHILLTYCYLVRHTLGDPLEDPESTLQVIRQLSASVLFSTAPGFLFSNANEVIVDVVDKIMEYEKDDLTTRTSNKRGSLQLVLLKDVQCLFEKTEEEEAAGIVRAVGDLWRTLDVVSKREKETQKRKAAVLAAKKAYFYLAYAAFLSSESRKTLSYLQVVIAAEQERINVDEQLFTAQQQAAEKAMQMKKRQSSIKIVEQD